MNNKELVFKNGTVKVGDVFVCSWGYEQTNVDFYQVIGLKGKKTVLVKQIKSKDVDLDGYLCGNCKPDFNNFKNDKTLERRICDYSSEPFFNVNSFSNAYKVDNINKKHEFSSYA